jgi:hypothetical protein
MPPDRLWSEIEADLADLRHFLTTLPESAWQVVGRHATGERPLAEMIEGYLVGHLEEHTAQLESLRG